MSNECPQHPQLETKLDAISEKLGLVLVQQNEIKNLNQMCMRLENWLKDHEHRLRGVEQKQKSCGVGNLSTEIKELSAQLKAVREDIDTVKHTPGAVALRFLKAASFLIAGGVITWVAKG